MSLDLTEATVLPPKTKVLSVTPSGASAWVHTERIECKMEDGSTRDYFKKACVSAFYLATPGN